MPKVREFMTGWESPDTHQMIPLVWSERDREELTELRLKAKPKAHANTFKQAAE